MSILYSRCLYVVLYDNVHGSLKELGILMRIVVTKNYFLRMQGRKLPQGQLTFERIRSIECS